ncbi:MAG: hypothetical protein CMO80_10320 [Verrucomicrobiales bacterium]|nr:hypothetical protein [Verrucomicrobiales bacterium]
MKPVIQQFCLVFAVVLGGCGGKIEVYDAPPDLAPPAPAPPSASAPAMPTPEMTWKDLPAGWEEVGGQTGMRFASFAITGDGGKAELAVFPFPGPPNQMGGEKRLVNMWRDQLGLAPVTDQEFEKSSQKIEAGGVEGTMFDINSGEESSGDRIVAAVVWAKGFTWFLKMSGDSALVAAQKPAFVSFLKGLTFGFKMPESMPSPQSGSREGGDRPNWKTPPHWEDLGAGMMQIAKYRASGEGGETEISVSRLGGAAGGIPANVNRWLGQVGKPSVTNADANALAKPIEVPAGSAKNVELSGDSKDMQVIMVSQGDSTWFFKSFGAKAAVEREKAAFVEFVKSVEYN